MKSNYDYIIAGAGAAGLSLAWQFLQSPLANKKILVVDDDLTPSNDKTWCFWDANTPPFANLIHKKWTQAEIGTNRDRFSQPLHHYPYYCLRSIDFQQEILGALNEHPNIDLLETTVSSFDSNSGKGIMHTEDKSYTASYVFQSCLSPWNDTSDQPKYPLLQHFVGWELELSESTFSESTFTLMDFDDTFNNGIAFIYLLPWTDKTGLIEYTIFSDELLPKEFYEEKLSLYLNHRFGLKPIDYEIDRREFGKIPMMDRPVKPWYCPNVLNIGTLGGVTKPSTGYTFRRIQRQVNHIVQSLLENDIPSYSRPSSQRYKAYDLWLLQIIHNHPKEALQVFYKLFENNTVDEVFRFLGEETSFSQDIKIMSSVPYLPFLRAMWKTRYRLPQI